MPLYRVTAGRTPVYLALKLIVLSDCLFIFSASPFWTLLIDAFPVYLSHPPWMFSESLHSGRDGLQPERDLQLLLYAGQWLALRRIVLQDIAVHCDAEYLRIGVHLNGHLNRQVSSLIYTPYSLYHPPFAPLPFQTTQQIVDVRGSFAKFVKHRDLGAAHPYQSVRVQKTAQFNIIWAFIYPFT